MEFKDIYTNHLNDIIELIRKKKINGENEALSKFDAYLDLIQEIGSFNAKIWRQDWRKKIWAFGEEFKNLNPQEFLNIISSKLQATTLTNPEVIEFIRSEIIVNFLPDKECKNHLEVLIQKFPLNPEFRNTLGHYYSREKEFFKASEEYRLAFKVDPNNHVFLENRFSKDQEYINDLIKKSEYQEAKEYVNKLFQDKQYLDAGNNIRLTLVSFTSRINDHLLFQDKLKSLENDFKDKLNQELDSERKRIIEVLGFFSAFVAFILSTVSIGKNFSFVEAIYFIVALGLILILFAVALSTLFTTTKTELFKDRKFWILISGLILLFLFIIMTNTIAVLIQKILG